MAKQERPIGIWACSQCSCNLWVPLPKPIGPCPACKSTNSWIDSRWPQKHLEALRNRRTENERYKERNTEHP
jgi:hypothetical protein